MRTKQNEVSDIISSAPTAERARLISTMKELKDELQKKEEELKGVMKEWQLLMVQVPNIPDMSVPEGDSDANNKEVRAWGTIPKFSFEQHSNPAPRRP